MISNQLFIEFKSDLLKIKDKKKLEKAYYDKLLKCLKSGQFKTFELLFNASNDFDIFIDIKKISNRFEIISNLLKNCIDKISNGYQTSALGEIIEILRLCNKFSLLDRDITELEKNFLNTFKRKKENKLFLENLSDLFGKVSNSFILFVSKVMPRDLYEYFINSPISYFPDRDELIDFIKNIFFYQYSVYGLNIRYLSSVENFLNVFDKKYQENPDKESIEFDIIYKYRIYYYDLEEEREHHETKKHLVFSQNLLKNKYKILDKSNYNFYSLSMVLLGGLGPQGLGFTYSTPKGEVIEICSDQRETKAIIIKYKQYLKRKFLIKLDKELTNLGVRTELKKAITNFLFEVLNPRDMIRYNDKYSILKKIKRLLNDEFQDRDKTELKEIINKISDAINIILLEIKLKDQFKTRMDLVAKGKIDSEDIAKLTSLRDKSHYDVLRERFFFQYLVDWFYDIYKYRK
ncbi:MAG: hypothetical protein ACFE8C_06760 [Promethearchaeota archaeon]